MGHPHAARSLFAVADVGVPPLVWNNDLGCAIKACGTNQFIVSCEKPY